MREDLVSNHLVLDAGGGVSKPRSRLIVKADHEFRTVKGFSTVIHFGKQAKHLSGQPNHDPSKSTITVPIQELQHLVELMAGTGHWVGTHKEMIDFGVVIGIYRKDKSENGHPTTRGTIHYSKTGTHVVPATPNPAVAKRSKS